MPRTKEQFNKIREATRRLILKTALELFAELGFNGTSMDDIAKKAGVSKGLAYTYFKSKRELLEVIIDEILVEKFILFDQIQDETDFIKTPYKKLWLIIDKYFDLILQDEKSLRLYVRLMLQPGILESSQERIAKFSGKIMKAWDLYRKLFKDLGYKDVETEIFLFSSILNGVFFEYTSHGKKFPLEKLRDLIKKKYSGNPG